MLPTFRSLAFGLAALFSAGAIAQNIVIVSGTVQPCNGVSYPVQIQLTTPPPVVVLIDTVVYTGANCSYSCTLYPSQGQGLVSVSTTCDGGITYMTDSMGFSPFFNTVVLNLTCGGGGTFDCTGILNGPNMPGTACDDGIPATDAYWSIDCVCTPDTAGNTIDCLGVMGGSALPGTSCNDNDPLTSNDVWGWDCVCAGSTNLDCNGVPNGPALPGTSCTIPGTILTGIWSGNCVCIPDTANAPDCLGVINGPNVPGTACDDNNPLTDNTIWSVNCDCVVSNNPPCEANFWVMQAYTDTSVVGGTGEPIPNVLWVWNLSSGGDGTFTFVWNFGDGSAPSTEAFPTHTYANGGPYLLCLTIADGTGCTDTYCDSISVDENGIYSGMVVEGEVRSTFTINVINPLTAGVSEKPALDELATWPNPVTDELNIQLTSSLRGSVNVDILDLSGRTVLAGNHMLSNGANRLSMPTGDLNPGMYLLRIGNGSEAQVLRFVKTR
ncbi:MAG: T9SS type A sorting domain-containing protein [Flavobacteriales bacterium]